MVISLKKTSHCYCRTHKVAARTTHSKAVTHSNKTTHSKAVIHSNTHYISGFQTVLRESQEIPDPFQGDPLVRFCNVCFEVHFILIKGKMFCQN